MDRMAYLFCVDGSTRTQLAFESHLGRVVGNFERLPGRPFYLSGGRGNFYVAVLPANVENNQPLREIRDFKAPADTSMIIYPLVRV
ncbi:MAG: hypothetical protein HY831_04810 [Candidatus Aenigmarchaeota archaeon]|nr:hypothetical protein [Candidatus Aenigmarchaeota archaeon]